MTSIHIHVLQHASYEGPGYIEQWADQNNYPLSKTYLFKNETLPKRTSFDLLVIMGGSMSVHDEDKFPWLVAEKEFIKACIDQKKAVVGICLGAQLIASALGADIYPNPHKEIGWFKVSKAASHDELLEAFPESFSAFHWHGDTFNLPRGTKHLMYSEACKNQAFSYGNHVMAFQFHPEVTPALVNDFIRFGKNEIISDAFIQTETEIKNGLANSTELNMSLEKSLNRLVRNYIKGKP